MIELPHDFLRSRAVEIEGRPAELPGPGRLGVAMCFLRREPARLRATRRRGSASSCAEAGHTPIGWRDVPVDETSIGEQAREAAPQIRQLFIAAGRGHRRGRLRAQPVRDPPPRRARARAAGLVPEHVLPDARLQGDADRAPAAAVLPRPARHDDGEPLRDRPLALLDQHRAELGAGAAAADDRPQRRDQHRPRQRQLDARPRGGALLRRARRRPRRLPAADRRGRLRLRRVRPRVRADGPRRAHAPARDDDDGPRRPGRAARTSPAELEGFYRYHGRLLEPWDGPAALAFCDGRTLGAMLDRNGLRPGRWTITRDGWVCLGSESGIFTVSPDRVARMGRLEPAQLFVVDLDDRARPHRRRGRGGGRRRRPLRRVVRGGQARRPRAARPARDDPADRAAAEAPARVRLHAGGPAGAARAAAPRRPRADRLDGQRRLAGGLLRPPAVAVLATSSSASPRSPTRPSTRSASTA